MVNAPSVMPRVPAAALETWTLTASTADEPMSVPLGPVVVTVHGNTQVDHGNAGKHTMCTVAVDAMC